MTGRCDRLSVPLDRVVVVIPHFASGGNGAINGLAHGVLLVLPVFMVPLSRGVCAMGAFFSVGPGGKHASAP